MYREVRTPLIASGGVSTWEDALEYILAGASAVGVGSAQFARPDPVPAITADLRAYLAREGLDSLRTLVGAAHPES